MLETPDWLVWKRVRKPQAYLDLIHRATTFCTSKNKELWNAYDVVEGKYEKICPRRGMQP